MNPLSFLRFFLRLPVIAFRISGLVRITNRARRGFRRVLRKEGLPEDIIEVLVEGLVPDVEWKKFLRRKT
ncbi:hypothetical protein [Thermococcus henrietii]|uniref:hypothetical protein n=1 Tax=Thermococcus henrietii TaxID=2016361 RepID=UPI000C07777C|nr:hypothetical protein [Thermococcus henrietii]